MSIYIPQYTEVETSPKPNCLCGENGRVRNERECSLPDDSDTPGTKERAGCAWGYGERSETMQEK